MPLKILLVIALIGNIENISFLWIFNNYLTNSLRIEILIVWILSWWQIVQQPIFQTVMGYIWIAVLYYHPRIKCLLQSIFSHLFAAVPVHNAPVGALFPKLFHCAVYRAKKLSKTLNSISLFLCITSISMP